MKTKRFLCVLLSVFLAGAMLVGCTRTTTPTTPGGGGGSAPTLTLSRTSHSMIYGDIIDIIASYDEVAGQTLTWRSSNEGVATVENGTVTAVGVGEAVITATYGSLQATCNITVSFGEYSPTLQLSHVSSSLSIGNGDSYNLSGNVLYNGNTFPCDLTVVAEDDSVVGYENGALVGKKIGTTTIAVSTVWNGYDNPLLKKTLTVNVVGNMRLVTTVTKGTESYISDNVEIYSVDEHASGDTFINTATLDFKVIVDSQEKEGTISHDPAEDKLEYSTVKGDVIELNGNTITAVYPGTATIKCSYTDENGTYETTFTVKVTCPVVRYTDLFRLEMDSAFPLSKTFGGGTKFLAGTQGDVELGWKSNPGQLTGLEVKGKETPAFEMITTSGGYYFENVDAYNCEFSEANADQLATRLDLAGGIVGGYFYVTSDIGVNEPVNMAGTRTSGNSERHIAATFDGQGHTINAIVGIHGFFASLGSGAVVKDTHFNFTFSTGSAGVKTGLAYNQALISSNVSVHLENLYITTTNFTESSYALFYGKPRLLTMNNVLVNLGGTASIRNFDGPTSGGENLTAALFGVDTVLGQGDNTAMNVFMNGNTNVYAVTGKFMPISNGKLDWWSSEGDPWDPSWPINFAHNDIQSTFGTVKRMGTSSSSYQWCMLTELQKHNDWIRKVYDGSRSGKYYLEYIGAYYGNPSLENSGIARYNTTADLRKAGVTKVGTWDVPA